MAKRWTRGPPAASGDNIWRTMVDLHAEQGCLEGPWHGQTRGEVVSASAVVAAGSRDASQRAKEQILIYESRVDALGFTRRRERRSVRPVPWLRGAHLDWVLTVSKVRTFLIQFFPYFAAMLFMPLFF